MCEYTTWAKCRIFSVKAGVYIVTTGIERVKHISWVGTHACRVLICVQVHRKWTAK